MLDAATLLNRRYGEGRVGLEINDQYYNMREKIEPVYHIVETVQLAMQELGIEPRTGSRVQGDGAMSLPIECSLRHMPPL